jgi:hypothetical protein
MIFFKYFVNNPINQSINQSKERPESWEWVKKSKAVPAHAMKA